MNLRAGRLRFQVQLTDSPAAVTAYAGLPLVIEAFRALGLPGAIRDHLHFKQRVRGYSEVTFIETLVALLAAGGECVDDVRVLHADAGLKRLWGSRRCRRPRRCGRSSIGSTMSERWRHGWNTRRTFRRTRRDCGP